jgi:predicted small lipoprotein YifL
MPGILTVPRRVLLAAGLLALAGCGLKGDLVLPDRGDAAESTSSAEPGPDADPDRERSEDDG